MHWIRIRYNCKTHAARIALFTCLLFLALPIMSATPPLTASPYIGQTLRVHFFNVGYGDAIIIELPDNTVALIDSGDHSHGIRLYEYLVAHNISTIDTVIITHPHKNHFGGLDTLAKRMPIKRVYLNGDTRRERGYDELLALLESSKIPTETIHQGFQVPQNTPDVTIDILHPRKLSASVNGNSMVTLLRFKDTLFLFTADIEPAQQDMLIEKFGTVFANAQYVQIPHHGGPISEKFTQFFRNTIFIISTGENEWGLPKKEQMQHLQGTIMRTDTHGTIVLESTGTSVKIIRP